MIKAVGFCPNVSKCYATEGKEHQQILLVCWATVSAKTQEYRKRCKSKVGSKTLCLQAQSLMTYSLQKFDLRPNTFTGNAAIMR